MLREGGAYRDDEQDRRCRLNMGVPPEMVQPGDEVPNAPQFTYQSMSGSNELVAFGGTLRFVPGTLREPQGEPFDVKVEHVVLEACPEYIY
eukprot:COSAG06_NODE_121_length_23085_cov_7.727791_20_plen_91_part_00